MNEPRGGWTFGRILGLIVGLVGLAGFGLCSLWGITVTGSALLENRDPTALALLAYVAPGVGLTLLSFLLVRAMIRRARRAPRE
jgi:H+/Cl- antiporter ClcA